MIGRLIAIALIVPLLIVFLAAFIPFDVLPANVSESFNYIYLRISYIVALFPMFATPVNIVFGFILPLEVFLVMTKATFQVYRLVVG